MNRKQKRQRNNAQGNFVLLVIFFVCLVVLLVVASITWTQDRLGAPKPTEAPIKAVIGELTQIRPEEEAANQAALEQAMNFWPSNEFPSVPQYKADKYRTSIENMCATIVIAPTDAYDLPEYIDSLVDSGAALHVRTENLVVLLQAGTEIQIRPTGSKPSITLCGEPETVWTNAEYSGLILPRTGKLVSVQAGNLQDDLVFTYRNAAISDAMQYLNDLKKGGWINTRRMNLKDNTLLANFKHGDMQLTIDYFTNGNYQITLGAISAEGIAEPVLNDEVAPIDGENWENAPLNDENIDDGTAEDQTANGGDWQDTPEGDQSPEVDPWGDPVEEEQPAADEANPPPEQDAEEWE